MSSRQKRHKKKVQTAWARAAKRSQKGASEDSGREQPSDIAEDFTYTHPEQVLKVVPELKTFDCNDVVSAMWSRTLPKLTTVGIAAAFGAGFWASARYYSKTASGMIPAARPPNFSWVVEGLLAGSAFPSQAPHFQYIRNQGIDHLVTLTEWVPPMHLAPPSLQQTHIAVEEFSAPSIEQMEEFTKLVDKAKDQQQGVCVHCYWGLGRTGTMLAAYLVHSEGMAPMAAITRIRHLRPYSIETYEQEDAVVEFAEHLVRKQAVADSSEEESGHASSSTKPSGTSHAEEGASGTADTFNKH